MAKKAPQKHTRSHAKQRSHFWESPLHSTLDETPYLTALKRALDCARTLDEKLDDLLLNVENIMTKLDLKVNGFKVTIDSKWATFETNHKISSCWISREMGKEIRHIPEKVHQPCNHIVIDLFRLILAGLSPEYKSGHRSDSDLLGEFGDQLRLMPHNLKCEQGEIPGHILVSWEGSEPDLVARSLAIRPKWYVVLHRQYDCEAKLFQLAGHGRSKFSCNYPSAIVSGTKVLFKGLDDELYFPMVRRRRENSLFGVPPKAINPTTCVKPEFEEMYFEASGGDKDEEGPSNQGCYVKDNDAQISDSCSPSGTISPILEHKVARPASMESDEHVLREHAPQLNIASSSRADEANATRIATLEADGKAGLDKVEAVLEVERHRVANAMALANSLAVLPGRSKRAGDMKEMSTREEKRAKRDNA
ncbi:hypothetical protein DL98DRAFT_595437 [Cadophora sp. DSE1049]|nr:hypothetical protein DL98DRAFT_595437 [Cadophora sp. DSE1049]